MNNDKIILRKAGMIARLVLNNPARLNAISMEMWQSVERIFDEIARTMRSARRSSRNSTGGTPTPRLSRRRARGMPSARAHLDDSASRGYLRYKTDAMNMTLATWRPPVIPAKARIYSSRWLGPLSPGTSVIVSGH